MKRNLSSVASVLVLSNHQLIVGMRHSVLTTQKEENNAEKSSKEQMTCNPLTFFTLLGDLGTVISCFGISN